MSQNLCKSFLLDQALATHDFSVDQFKAAFYGPSASLDPDVVTAYITSGEVVGSGYTAGGVLLTRASGFPKLSPTGARKMLMTFNDIGPILGNGFSYRQLLIYNASKSNKGVAVVDFGGLQVVTASYGVSWPVPDDDHCLIRLGA